MSATFWAIAGTGIVLNAALWFTVWDSKRRWRRSERDWSAESLPQSNHRDARDRVADLEARVAYLEGALEGRRWREDMLRKLSQVTN